MGATTRHLPVGPGTLPVPSPFLAADVGGTHVRVGLVDSRAPDRLLHYAKYPCAGFAGLAEVLQAFLSGLPDASTARRGVIACAGHAREDGTVLSVNLPWPVAPRRVRDKIGFDELLLVNDFEALAHAVAATDAHALLRLSGPDAVAPGPTLVVGPGTGLGAAVRIPGVFRSTLNAQRSTFTAVPISPITSSSPSSHAGILSPKVRSSFDGSSTE